MKRILWIVILSIVLSAASTPFPAAKIEAPAFAEEAPLSIADGGYGTEAPGNFYTLEIRRNFMGKAYLRLVSDQNGKILMHGEILQNYSDAVETAGRIAGGTLVVHDRFSER